MYAKQHTCILRTVFTKKYRKLSETPSITYLANVKVVHLLYHFFYIGT